MGQKKRAAPRRALIASALTVIALAGLAHCSKESSGGGSRGEVRLRVVHDPSLSPLISRLSDLFAASNPRLPTGEKIQIDLVPLNDVRAAKALSSGAIKSEAWLAPSSSLIEYTNTNLTNLGPAQTDCQELFSTPIVAATLKNNADFAGAGKRLFSWSRFFSEKLSVPANAVSLSHASPSSSPSGLAGLLELAYLALEPGAALNIDTLKSKAAWDRLGAYESKVSNYGASDARLLERASSSIASRIRFAITSEQSLAKFNESRPEGRPKLIALYPEEGSIWLDYQLCASRADWTTPAHAAALNEFKKFLAGETAQSLARIEGFRTSVVKFKKSPPLSEENGINLDLPNKSFNPAPGVVIGHLLKSWPELAKPSAFALVLDGSGSMEGERIFAAKDAARRFIAAASARDVFSLFSFSSEPQNLLSLSSDRKTAIQAVDAFSAAGGSAIYDSTREAIINLSAQKIKDYRKTLVLITDGEDKNSTTPLQRLLDFANERSATLDINLIILALKDEGQDFSDLKKLAEAGRGQFIETNSDSLVAAMESLIQSL